MDIKLVWDRAAHPEIPSATSVRTVDPLFPCQISYVDSVTRETVICVLRGWPSEEQVARLDQMRLYSKTVDRLVHAEGETLHLGIAMFLQPEMEDALTELIGSVPMQTELQRRLRAMGFRDKTEIGHRPALVHLEDYRTPEWVKERVDAFEELLHGQGLAVWYIYQLILYALAKPGPLQSDGRSLYDLHGRLSEVRQEYQKVIERELSSLDRAFASRLDSRIVPFDPPTNLIPHPLVRLVVACFR